MKYLMYTVEQMYFELCTIEVSIHMQYCIP